MVYKKYIKRNGKTFGPYYYESYRVGNSVKKRYIGTSLPSVHSKTSPKISKISRTFHIEPFGKSYSTRPWHVFTLIGVLLIVLVFSILLMRGTFITGHAVAELSSDALKIKLERGELMPADVLIQVIQGNETEEEAKEYSLGQLIPLGDVSDSSGFQYQPINGSFYLRGINISGYGAGYGSGLGYGVPAKKLTPVDVFFEFRVLTNASAGAEAGEEFVEPVPSQPQPTQPPLEISNQTQEEGGSEESRSEEGRSLITGFTILTEPEKIIGGKVKYGEEYVYNIGERKYIELVKGTARTLKSQLNDSVLRYSVIDGDAVFVTDYQEMKEGFGVEFLENNTLPQEAGGFELSVPYEKLNMKEGSVEIIFSYEEQEITRITGSYNEPRSIGLPELGIPSKESKEPPAQTTEEEQEKQTTNQTITEDSLTLKQGHAILGQPVKWTQIINATGNKNLTISLPKETISATLRKMKGGVEVGVLEIVESGVLSDKVRKTGQPEINESEKTPAERAPITGVPTTPTTGTPSEESVVPNASDNIAPVVPNGTSSNQTNQTSDNLIGLPVISKPEAIDNIPGIIEGNSSNNKNNNNANIPNTDNEIISNPSPITGFTINDGDLIRSNWLFKFFRKFFSFFTLRSGGITGQAIDTISSGSGGELEFATYNTLASQENITIEVTSEGTYEIEYYTTPPYSEETALNIGAGKIKEVKVVGVEPNGEHYTNITAFTRISENLNINNKNQLVIIDKDNNKNVEFAGVDKNGNDIIDRLEWNVDRLSNRTYHIIISNISDYQFGASSFFTGNQTQWNYGTYFNATANSSGQLILNEEIHAGWDWVNTTGLVALYHFNNDSIYGENDTRVYDFSGMGNNGTAVNGTLMNTTGKIRGAVTFDGVNDFINIPNNPVADNGTGVTFGGWVKPASSGTSIFFLRGKDGYGAGWSLSLDAKAGQFPGAAAVTMSGGATQYTATGTTNLTEGTWYHIIGWYVNGVEIKVFVNGVAEGTQSLSGSTQLRNSTIGIRLSDEGNYFNGSIDEIAIWNRSIQSNEILNLYNAQKDNYPPSGYYNSQVFDSGSGNTTWHNMTWSSILNKSSEIHSETVNATGLVGLWHLNNDSTYGENDTRVYDFSGLQNNGTVYNGTVMNTTGKIRGAGSFDGVNDYVNVSNSASFGFTSAFTTSAWIKPSAMSSWTGILHKMTNASIDLWALSYDGANNLAQFYITSGGVNTPKLNSIATFSEGTNTWYFVTGVYNGSDLRIYINGVLDNSAARTGAMDVSSNSVLIGKTFTTEYWNGSLDEVAIWNRSLSAEEIQNLYVMGAAKLGIQVRSCNDVSCSGENWTGQYGNGQEEIPAMGDNATGLTGLWHLNNDSAYGENDTRVYDFSGRGNDGKAYNGTFMNASGKIKGALTFNGVNQSINTSKPFSNFISAANGTMALWMRPIGAALSTGRQWSYETPGVIADSGGYAGIHRGETTNGDRIWIFNYDGTTDEVGITYNVDEWVHIAWVHRDGTLYGYKNGVLVGSTASGNTELLSGALKIGMTFYNQRVFNGSIDEVAVWNRSLNATEIMNLYQHSVVKYFDSSPITLNSNLTPTNRYIQYRVFMNTTNTTVTPFIINTNITASSTELGGLNSSYSNTTTNASGATLLLFTNESEVGSMTDGEIMVGGPVSTQGLVVLYHLNKDRVYGENDTRIYDFSGNQNNGTAMNGTVMNTTGKIRGAGTFDGSDDCINISFTGRPANNFTFGGWIKTSLTHEVDTESSGGTDGVSGQKYAFSPNFVGNPNSGAGLSVGTNGISVYEHSDSYMPPFAVYDATIGSGWNHIIVTYTDKTSRIYLNGTLVRTGLISSRPNIYAPPALGEARCGSNYGPFGGSMDEVAIWNRSLSATEITALYNAQAGRYYLANNFANVTGLVALYHLNNDSVFGENNTRVYDFSGMQNNGTAYNGVVMNATGKIKGAGTFDGVNDYVNVSDSESMNITGNFTILLWVKTSSSATQDLFRKVHIFNTTNVQVTATARTVYNGDNVASKMFDGSESGAGSTGWGNSNQLPEWARFNFTNGSKIITKYRMIPASQQVGGWNSEAYNPKTWVMWGYNGTGWDVLDNISDAGLTMNAWKDFPINNVRAYSVYNWSISANEGPENWIRVTEFQFQYPDYGFMGQVDSGKFRYGLFNNDTTSAAGSVTINDSSWHLLTLTFNGTHASSYIDGVLDSFTSSNGSGSTSGIPLSIGGGDLLNFSGSLDEVAIWNRSLSATEIYDIYEAQRGNYPQAGAYTSKIFTAPNTSTMWNNLSFQVTYSGSGGIEGSEINATSGAAGEETNTTGLVALYHLNNDSAYGENQTRVYDFSGNQNNGTCTNCPVLNTSGKIRGAGTFDGVNDYVNISISGPLSNIYTLSLWVYPTGTFNKACSEGDSCSSLIVTGNQNVYFALNATGIMQIYNGSSWNNANTALSLNSWQLLTVTSNSSLIQFYLNGNLDKNINGTSLNIGNVTYIATRPDQINIVYSFNGSLDEVAIWNRSLSSTEILNLYNKQRNRFQFSVRNCSASDCAGGGDKWKGPYYSNNATFNLSGGQYFQYRAELATGNRSLTPWVNGTDIYYTSNDLIIPQVNVQSPTNTSYPKLTTRIDFNLSADEPIGSAYLYLDAEIGDSPGFLDLGNGLVGAWHFNNQSEYGENGTLFYDFSGNQNNLTCDPADATYKCPIFNASGRVRGGYTWNEGISKVGVKMFHNSILNSTSNAITISYWFKANGPSYGGEFGGIERYSGGDGSNEDIFLGCNWPNCEGNLSWLVKNNSGANIFSLSYPYYVATAGNNWTYWVGTFNGSYAALYKEGVLVNESNTSVYTIRERPQTSSTKWCIGTYVCDRAVNGTIDEVAIWNRSLSASEISAIYNAQKGILMQNYNESFANYTNTTMNEGAHRVWFAVNDTAGNANSTTSETIFSITPVTCSIWNGSTSTNWSVAGNWNNNYVPNATECVIINGNYTNAPVLSVPTAIYNLSIGASNTSILNLSMAWGASLNVSQSVHIGPNGTLRHQNNSNAENYNVNMTIGGNLLILSGGTINVSGRGYISCYGPGAIGAHYRSGSGYGGTGGAYTSAIGMPYGNVTAPIALGSGQGCTDDTSYTRSKGGGAVILNVTGQTNVTGSIESNVLTTDSTGGATGGSIYLKTGTLVGTGTMSTSGLSSGFSDWAMGSGGRTAIIMYGGNDTGSINITSLGGYSPSYPAGQTGAAGTIYIKKANEQHGSVTISNYNVATGAITSLTANATERFDSITISNRARLHVGGNGTAYTNNITMSSIGTLYVQVNSTLKVMSQGNITGSSQENATIIIDGNLTFDTFTTMINWTGVGLLDNGQVNNISNNLTIAGLRYVVNESSEFNSNSNITVENAGVFELGKPSNLGITIKNLFIKSGGNVTHSQTPAGNAEVYKLNLTILGNLTVESGGTINVSGKGFISCYGPGATGAHYRSGSGYGGYGGTYGGSSYGSPYGSTTAPTNLGSGQGCDDSTSYTRSRGGGAVIINVTGITNVTGSIESAPSSPDSTTGGTGGSIYLTTRTLVGTGRMSTSGLQSGYSDFAEGSGGRIAVILTSGNDFGSVTMQSYGGYHPSYPTGSQHGAAGTVYTKKAGESYGSLTVDNNNALTSGDTYSSLTANASERFDAITVTNYGRLRIGTNGSINSTAYVNNITITNYGRLYVPSALVLKVVSLGNVTGNSQNNSLIVVNGNLTFDNLTTMINWTNVGLEDNGLINNLSDNLTIAGFRYVMNESSEFNSNRTNLTIEANGVFETAKNGLVTLLNLFIKSGGNVTHSPNIPNLATQTYTLNLSILGNLTIESGGTINVTGKGFGSCYGPGATGTHYRSGSGYGGTGSPYGAPAGQPYGSATAPTDLGSGQGCTDSVSYTMSRGGGAVKINVTGITNVTGTIEANSGPGLDSSRGASGGSIYLTTGTLVGTGAMTTNGWQSGYSDWAMGSGGRVAVILTSGNDFGSVTMQSYGGYHPSYPTGSQHGAAGTVYTKKAGESYGSLTVDNNNKGTGASIVTLLNNTPVYQFQNINITGRGHLQLGTNVTNVYVIGNLTFSQYNFSAGSATVTLNGTAKQTIDVSMGNSSFYRLNITNNGTVNFTSAFRAYGLHITPIGGASIIFNTGKSNNATISDELNIRGASGALVYLNSTNETDWYFNAPSSHTISSVWVRHSNASIGAKVYGRSLSTDAGFNTNWDFADIDSPQINFTTNTPVNNTSENPNSAFINISASDDLTNHSVVLDWNKTLVGWWRFNNETGENETRIKDWSTYSNNGTAYNGVVINSSGKLGKAGTFDGVNDYVSIADSSSLQFNTGQSITISVWVKPVALPDYGTIFIKGRTTGTNRANYAIRQGDGASTTQKLVFYYRNSSDNSWNVFESSDNIFTATGTWYHVAASYTFGTGSSIQLYSNGNNISGTWVGGSGNETPYVSTEPAWIGADKYSVNPAEQFNGSIDDVQIYSRALAAAEIQSIYNASAYKYARYQLGLADGNYTYQAHAQDFSGNVNSTEWRMVQIDAKNPGVSFSTSTPANNSAVTENNFTLSIESYDGAEEISAAGTDVNVTGLVALYHLNNDSTYGENATRIYDFSGMQNNGSCDMGSADCPALNSSGKLGKAFTFDATDDYVNAGNGATLELSSTGTVSGWFKLNAASQAAYSTMMQKRRNGNDNGPYNLDLSSTGSNIRGYIGNGATINAVNGSSPSAGTWYYWVMTWNGSLVSLYQDGSLVTTTSQTINAQTGTGGLNIGSGISSGDVRASFFNGSIDEVAIWNRSLSASEVSNIYNLQKDNYKESMVVVDVDGSLVSWWRFENGTLIDEKRRNNGTAQGGVAWNSSGKYGDAMTFDGVNDYVNVSDGGSLNLSSNFTISVWIKPSSTLNYYAAFVSKITSEAAGHGYELIYNNGGKIILGIHSSGYRDWQATQTLNVGTWYHLVGVWNGSLTTAQIFVNGVEISGSKTGASGNFDLAASNAPLGIGAWIAGNSRFFNGSIDEVLIFNRSLNSSEVQSLYNASQYKYTNSFNLTSGTHNYRAYSQDLVGNMNDTGPRTINISSNMPRVSFVSPTLANGSAITNDNSIYVNVSSSDDLTNHSVILDWNKTLVGWWRFNSESGDNATHIKDKSIYENNATAKNGTVINSTGKLGGAGHFDGSNDFAEVADSSSLTISDSITIAAWIYPRGSSGAMISKGANGYSGTSWDFYINSNSNLVLENSGTATTTGTITTNKWQHVAVIANSTATSFYINGVADSGNPNGDAGVSNAARSIFIGKFRRGDYNFNGIIDDLQVYSRSLTQAEVQSIYNASAYQYYNNFTGLANANYTFQAHAQNTLGNVNSTEWRTVQVAYNDSIQPNISFVSPTPANGTTQSATAIYVNVSSSDNFVNHSVLLDWNRSLVGWWRFNNESGENETRIKDWSTWENNGTAIGGVVINASGKLGKAGTFDGGNDYVNISTLIPAPSSFSYVIWVYPTSLTSLQPVLGEAASNWGGFNWHGGGTGQFYVGTDVATRFVPSDFSSNTIVTNQWQHFVYTYNGTNGQVYKNGELIAGPKVQTSPSAWNGFLIGENSGNTINGSIDDVMIFSRALSAAEIQSIYNASAYQYSRNFTGLTSDKNYTFIAYAQDYAGQVNNTLHRTVQIVSNDSIQPNVTFVSPTPANGTAQSATSIYVNVSSSDNFVNHSVVLDWNRSLVGWWRFNNESGENATFVRDWSTYSNNGTAYNGVVINTSGKLGKAGTFDGGNDYVNVTDTDALSAWTSGTMTLCGWVKLNSYPSGGQNRVPIVAKGDGSSYEYALYIGNITNNNNVSMNLWQIGGNDYLWVYGGVIQLNTWSHVCGVYDNSSATKGAVYLDGVNVGTATTTSGAQTAGTSPVNIGRRPDDATNQYLNGSIDDVQIYSRALNLSEIRAIYNASAYQYYNNFTGLANANYTFQAHAQNTLGNVNSTEWRTVQVAYNDSIQPNISFVSPTPANGTTQSATSIYVNVSSNDNFVNHSVLLDWNKTLVGWWRFNNESGENETRIKDWSTYSNNGTAYNGVVINSSGKLGKAGTFDGSNDYVNLTYSGPIINASSDFTIAFWANPSTITSDQYIVDGLQTGDDNNPVVILGYQDGFWNIFNGSYPGGNADNSKITATAGVWQHVVYTTDGSALKGYVNGLLNITYTGSFRAAATLTGFSLGRSPTGGGLQYYNGSIDDVQIYNRALNLSEIQAIYNATAYQYYRNFTGLTSNANYTFVAYAQDYAGQVNNTLHRTIQIISNNTAPNLTAIGIQSENGTALLKSLNVNCTFNLTDGNAGDALSANWSFYKNNASNLANGTVTNINNSQNVTVQLMKANITKGESWKCSVIPFDGITNSSTLNSSEIIVQNSPPTVYLLLLNGGNTSTNRYPNFTWIAEDADNGTDTQTYTFNLSCYAGCSGDNKLITGLAQTNYSVMSYLRYLSDDNYYYNWSVKANDGTIDSSWATARNFTMQSLVSFSIVNSTLLFGSLNPLDRKNTTDGSIGPFNITNEGNVFINITINASNIWSRASIPTANYQFKVDNSTSEPGAFAWGKSNTSWAYIPGVSGMAIGYLNWTDTKDTAEVDIHLTVPSDEPAGAKTSVITFEASYADEWGR